jgi:hypothetical protein
MKRGAVAEVGLRSGSEARVLEKHVRIITCRLSGSLMARVVIWVKIKARDQGGGQLPPSEISPDG